MERGEVRMSNYDKIAWLPLCGGLTGLGLVLSYLVMRRRGLSAGLRGAAWSLLPLAAYLTGSIEMFWKMGVAIGDFAKGFVFSDRVWSGIAVAGLSLVLFMVSGGVRRRRVKRGKDTGSVGSAGSTQPGLGAATGGELASRSGTLAMPDARQPARQAAASQASNAPSAGKRRSGKAADEGDEDMKDIEDILRRRGIS
jgi:hypothetical protein